MGLTVPVRNVNVPHVVQENEAQKKMAWAPGITQYSPDDFPEEVIPRQRPARGLGVRSRAHRKNVPGWGIPRVKA